MESAWWGWDKKQQAAQGADSRATYRQEQDVIHGQVVDHSILYHVHGEKQKKANYPEFKYRHSVFSLSPACYDVYKVDTPALRQIWGWVLGGSAGLFMMVSCRLPKALTTYLEYVGLAHSTTAPPL